MSKVSVIVPVYNSEKYISKCLNSLVTQTLDDIEIIIVDDYSTDNSLQIIEYYQEIYPKKIKVIENKVNSGAATARNIGLEHATGEYIGFVDSDDYVLPKMYERLVDSIEETSANIAKTGLKMLWGGLDLSKLRNHKDEIINERIIIPKENTSFLILEAPGVTTKLFRRNILDNRKFKDGLKWEDYPFTIPLLASADKVASTMEKDYMYNMHINNTTMTDARKLSPKVLDIFTGSDMILEECSTYNLNNVIKFQLSYIPMQHCIARLKDVAGSNISLQDKKELLTLMSELINIKYGFWQEHPLYQLQKESSFIHGLRMSMIEKMLLPTDSIPKEEESVKQLIKTKINDTKKTT